MAQPIDPPPSLFDTPTLYPLNVNAQKIQRLTVIRKLQSLQEDVREIYIFVWEFVVLQFTVMCFITEYVSIPSEKSSDGLLPAVPVSTPDPLFFTMLNVLKL